jgi:hypothetical protein
MFVAVRESTYFAKMSQSAACDVFCLARLLKPESVICLYGLCVCDFEFFV